MKYLINLKKTLLITITLISLGLTLASCSKIRDELAIREIKSAKEPSDIFESMCVKTKADTNQIRRIVMSLQWEEKPLPEEQKRQKFTGMWISKVNNTSFAVTIGQGIMDPEVGHAVDMFILSYVGNEEPAFVQNVISKSGLQRVDQNNQIRKRSSDAIVLSDTGRETGSFIVVPLEYTIFGLRNVMAIAIRPSN